MRPEAADSPSIPTGYRLSGSFLLAGRQDLAVYQNPAGEERSIGVKGRTGPYAECRELSETEAEIFFLKDDMESLRPDTVFTSLFSFERRMICHESLILHCAYIKHEGKAILFSAPSGTGKSTKADLWEKYRGSRTVNGDRALLRKKNGIWHACGWPVCGSPRDLPSGRYTDRRYCHATPGEREPYGGLIPVAGVYVALRTDHSQPVEPGVCLKSYRTA